MQIGAQGRMELKCRTAGSWHSSVTSPHRRRHLSWKWPAAIVNAVLVADSGAASNAPSKAGRSKNAASESSAQVLDVETIQIEPVGAVSAAQRKHQIDCGSTTQRSEFRASRAAAFGTGARKRNNVHQTKDWQHSTLNTCGCKDASWLLDGPVSHH